MSSVLTKSAFKENSRPFTCKSPMFCKTLFVKLEPSATGASEIKFVEFFWNALIEPVNLLSNKPKSTPTSIVATSSQRKLLLSEGIVDCIGLPPKM